MGWRERLLRLLGIGKPPEPSQASDKASTQAITRARKRLVAVIGLDFGTSCTKCVIGVAGRAVAVPFSGLSPKGSPYLLPTQLWLEGDRSLSLRPSRGAQPISGIKVGLMRVPDSAFQLGGGSEATPVTLAAAYLGLVIRHACEWLVAEKRGLLGDVDLTWQLNVGLPAKSHDDIQTSAAFRRAVHAAWVLSRLQGKLYLGVCSEEVRAMSDGSYELPGITADAVNLIPEVAAEVVGYARSAQKRLGPHLMIDVGATTVDVCLFKLSEQGGGYQYAFYATDVNPELGAFQLHRKRRLAIDPAAKEISIDDPLRPIPPTYRDYPGANGAAKEVDHRFLTDVEAMVRTVAVQAKKKRRSELIVEMIRHRGLEREDRDKDIRVLMCGGGSRIPLYVEATKMAGEALAPGGWTKLRLKRFGMVRGLEYPARLDAPELRRADFDRLAVAYGLSYSVDNIGQFTPPSEMDPEPRWWTVEFEERRP
jgi:hypothetical protein